MSHTETHFGKLRKVDIGDSLENWCKEQCNKEGITELSDYNKKYVNSWVYEFRNSWIDNNRIIIVGEEVFEIFDHIESEDEDIDYMVKNPDGTYTFLMQFYNGGTYLGECLEEGLNRINKQ